MGDSAGGCTEWRFPVEIVLLKKLEEEGEKMHVRTVQLEEVVRAS